MGRRPGYCKVCHHPQRAAIDIALVTGEELTVLARLYNVSVSTLRSHTNHTAKNLRSIKKQGDADAAEILLALIADHQDTLLDLFKKALDKEPDLDALELCDRIQRGFALLGKVHGLIQTGTKVVIWQQLGVKDEEEAKNNLDRFKRLQTMSEAERIESCERYLLPLYRARPDLVERSKLMQWLREPVPEAEEVA